MFFSRFCLISVKGINEIARVFINGAGSQVERDEATEAEVRAVHVMRQRTVAAPRNW